MAALCDGPHSKEPVANVDCLHRQTRKPDMRRALTAMSRLILVLIIGAGVVDADSSELNVRSVAKAFGEALKRGDVVTALALLHPEVVIFEGGRAETKEQYSRAHIHADIAFASVVRRETLRDTVIVQGDIAVYASESRARGRYRNRDLDLTTSETMVLTRTPDGWRIVHIRWP